MQLKSIGESLNALNAIKSVLKSFEGRALVIQKLRTAMSSYSIETVKSAIAQLTLNEEQIRAILIEKGLTGQLLETTTAELAQATATNTLAVSEGVATTATAGFKNAVKGLGASMKTFALSNPILTAIAAIGITVYGAVKAFDALTVSIDEAIEKTKSSKEELDQLTSEISGLNQELETTKDRIDELLEKANSGTISLLEEKELNNLREQNDELQREIALKEKLAEMDAKEVAENAANSITYKTDDDHWDDEYNATDRIDKLQKYVDSANFYQEKIAEVNQQILDIEESATDSNYKNSSTYKNLIKQQEKYQDELKEAEEQMSSTYKALSVEDDGLYYNGKVIEGYEDLAERLDTVYAAVELYLNDGSIEDTIKEYVETIKTNSLNLVYQRKYQMLLQKDFQKKN